MRAMGLRAIYRRPSTSRRAPEHRVYPYLLGNVRVTRPNQSLAPTPIGGVGSGHHLPAHGPEVPLPGGGHGLAQPVRGGLATVQHPPIRVGARLWMPGFAPGRWRRLWARAGRRISMDWKGRYSDNILVERLWRTVKYEEVYLKAYANVLEAQKGLEDYFRFYKT